MPDGSRAVADPRRVGGPKRVRRVLEHRRAADAAIWNAFIDALFSDSSPWALRPAGDLRLRDARRACDQASGGGGLGPA